MKGKFKYDLTKLTREQVEKIVTTIRNGCFCRIENFMVSHKKHPRPLEDKEKDLIELIDPDVDINDKNANDVFARYHPKEDYLSTSAFDPGCFWDKAVHLYQDHYVIPDYIMYNDAEEMKRYREMLDDIFAKAKNSSRYT